MARLLHHVDSAYVLMLAFAAFALLVNLGWPNLFLFDESLYCGATADMAAHGRWLYPTDDGEFFWIYGKPPLINWLQQASTFVFGWSIYTLRLPTALGMLGLVILTSWTARVLISRRAGIATAGLMVLSSHLMHTGRHILLEDLVAPLFAASLLLYACAVRASGPEEKTCRARRLSLLVGAGLTMAAAILTKQAFGLFAPAAVVVAELVLCRRGALARLFVTGASCIAGSAWWFVASYRAIGKPFLESLVGYHLQSRFAEVLENHPRGLNAYALSLDEHLAVLPWAVAVLGWAMVYRRLTEDWQRFLFIAWSALALLEFLVVGQVVKTFLPWYQVVVVPVLFVGAAHLLLEWLEVRALPTWLRWSLPLAVAIAGAVSARLDAVWVLLALLALGALVTRRGPGGEAHGDGWRARLGLWMVPERAELVLVCLIGTLGVIVANPGYGRDGRYRVTAALREQALEPTRVVVVGGEWRRVWMCYTPLAKRVEWSNSCDTLAAQLAGAEHVILEGEAAACPPGSLGGPADEILRGKTGQGPVALYHMVDSGRPASAGP